LGGAKILDVPGALLLDGLETEGTVRAASRVVDQANRPDAVQLDRDAQVAQQRFIKSRRGADEILDPAAAGNHVAFPAEGGDEVSDHIASVGAAVQPKVFARNHARLTLMTHVRLGGL